jgi:hypothetical protein
MGENTLQSVPSAVTVGGIDLKHARFSGNAGETDLQFTPFLQTMGGIARESAAFQRMAFWRLSGCGGAGSARKECSAKKSRD